LINGGKADAVKRQIGNRPVKRVPPPKGQIMKFADLLGIFPRARANDPITSYEAADSIKEVAKHHIQIIADCLAIHGPLGKDGISNCTKLDPNQVARRLSEMEKLGFIQVTGNKVKSNTGRNEREWEICVK